MTVSISLTVDTSRVQRALQIAPSRIEKAILNGLRRGSEVVVKKAQRNLQRGITPTGSLRGSIWYKIDTASKISYIGPGMKKKGSKTFGDPANYGFFVEFGRKPGGYPPRAVIKAWTQKVLGLSGAELNRVSRAIQHKIATKGVPPNPYLVPALEASRAEVIAVFNREVEKAVAAVLDEASQ